MDQVYLAHLKIFVNKNEKWIKLSSPLLHDAVHHCKTNFTILNASHILNKT